MQAEVQNQTKTQEPGTKNSQTWRNYCTKRLEGCSRRLDNLALTHRRALLKYTQRGGDNKTLLKTTGNHTPGVKITRVNPNRKLTNDTETRLSK